MDEQRLPIKLVPGFEGRYIATEEGDIFSVKSKNDVPRPRPLQLKQRDMEGYKYVNVVRRGKKTHVAVSRMVLCAYTGEWPDDKDAAHLDGDPSNNHIDNLAWATRSENEMMKHDHSTMVIGEDKPDAKLTENEVRQIRVLHEAGHSAVSLGKRFGCSDKNIAKIVHRETWRHV